MRSVPRCEVAMVGILVWLAIAAPLVAQSPREPDRRSTFASFTGGGSVGDGDPALALAASLGFRLSDRLGLEFELAHARRLDFTLDLCPPPRVCVIGGQLPVTGRTLALVPQLVVELLPSSRRFRAYVQAGAGAGHVRQRYLFAFPFTDVAQAAEFTRSNLVGAFAFGGGVTVQVAERLGLGVDARSLHLTDDEANPDEFITPAGVLSTLRVGCRVSWKF